MTFNIVLCELSVKIGKIVMPEFVGNVNIPNLELIKIENVYKFYW